MKADETQSNETKSKTKATHRVLDRRKQPIRGLWQRGDRFYARLKVEDAIGKNAVRWIPLLDENEQPLETGRRC